MSLPEISFRIQRSVREILEKKRISRGWRPISAESVRLACPLFPVNENLLAKWNNFYELDRGALDELLKGSIDLFGVHGLAIGRPVNWHRDPYSGKSLPRGYGKKIDYRKTKQVGNIKFIWELGRHQHLIPLALAYAAGGPKEYLDYCIDEIDHFISQNPFGLGVHWCSALEVGLRVLSWCFIYSFIALKMGVDVLTKENILSEKVQLSIYEHIWFVCNYLSRHSSANNHLIGELTCIWVACNVFNVGQEGFIWREYAKKQLEIEAQKQNFPDGVNKEQSMYYHFCVLEYFFLAYLISLRTQLPFSKQFYQIILRMFSFLESIQDSWGNIPQFGDSDDGVASVFNLRQNISPIKQVMEAVKIFYEGSDDCDTIKSYWYNAIAKNTLDLQLAVNTNAKSYPLLFKQGGFIVFGIQGIHIVFKCGPFGYLSISAHGHADALSIYLSLSGREFLIDPGTYAYHTKKRWRNYFRGTSAHNTVRVDGLDQSVIGGNFMWLKKADAQCEVFESGEEADQVIGSHNGYLRLKDPLLHRRKLKLDKKNNSLIVEDHFECKSNHYIERFWHFSEQCRVWQNKNSLWSENHGITICLECKDSEFVCVKGQNDPPCGWVSRKLDLKVPSWTGIARNEISGETILRTVISLCV